MAKQDLSRDVDPDRLLLIDCPPVTEIGCVSQGGYVLFGLPLRYDLPPNLGVGGNVTNVLYKVYCRNLGLFHSEWCGQPRNICGSAGVAQAQTLSRGQDAVCRSQHGDVKCHAGSVISG